MTSVFSFLKNTIITEIGTKQNEIQKHAKPKQFMSRILIFDHRFSYHCNDVRLFFPQEHDVLFLFNCLLFLSAPLSVTPSLFPFPAIAYNLHFALLPVFAWISLAIPLPALLDALMVAAFCS
eukprot:452391_1